MLKGFRESPAMLAAALFLVAVSSAPSTFAQQAVTTAANPAVPATTDKYLWLEDVYSPRSMAWVKAEDASSLKVLESDPHYAAYHAEALKLSEAPDRLPTPDQLGGEIYNLWRDASHVNGIFRKTTLADYLTKQPTWKTVIDYDALGKQDNVKWVSKGVDCLYPGDRYCMVALSAGGEDADTQREFDLKSGKFVEGGFILPHSKQDVGWLDKDTLIVARDWGAGTMTSSGYPFIIKLWKRGTPLDAAKEVFRGKPTDLGASGYTLHDAKGHLLTLFVRSVTIFESQTFVLTPNGSKQLIIPAKSSVSGLIDGRVLLSIDQDWTPAGQMQTFKQGSLLEMKLSDVMKDPAHPKPSIVFEPTANEFLQGAATTKSRLLLTTLSHAQGRAYVYSPGLTGWTRKQLPVPENVSVDIVSTSSSDDNFFLGITGFLTPPSLFLGDAITAALTLEKTEPARFDASKDVVEQLEATSKDGTKIPYFIAHPKNLQYNGSNPTLLNAYGGFQISETPSYSPNIGKLWLEHGGIFVLANIRVAVSLVPHGMRPVSRPTASASSTISPQSAKTLSPAGSPRPGISALWADRTAAC